MEHGDALTTRDAQGDERDEGPVSGQRPLTTADDLPLGKPTAYPVEHDPGVLRGVARASARRELGIDGALPFHGEDVWHGYELSWLTASGLPRIGVLTMRVPCDSPAVVESKSLKLYLNSLAYAVFATTADVATLVSKHVAAIVGADVSATIRPPDALPPPGDFGSFCLDALDAQVDRYLPSPQLLTTTGEQSRDAVHTHLFRTVCPITGQPDWGAVEVAWRGRRLHRNGLLAYLVSYRQSPSFHEHAVERIFVDLLEATAATELTVDGRFLRRGGIDINPYRSTTGRSAPATRLYRQ